MLGYGMPSGGKRRNSLLQIRFDAMMIQKKTVPNNEIIPEIARLLKEGSEVSFSFKGSSMLPFIRGERDTVVLSKAEELRKGDIVLALIEGKRYVLHRIIEINGSRVILMGDGNISGIEKCSKDDVLARAVKIVRNGREIDCRSKKHIRTASIWRTLLPVRRLILAIYRRTLLNL